MAEELTAPLLEREALGDYMAGKPQKQEITQERRGSPVFRQRAQEAYELLRGMIKKQGGADISDGLEDKPLVEDVMRLQPEMVGALLDSAWQLRSHSELSPYFQSAEGAETVVEEHDQPIGPCGRTYDSTIQAHLFGATRLYMRQQENEWVKEKVSNPKALDKDAVGGIGNALRRMVGMKIKVNEAAVRSTYVGHGLYETIKPYLLDAGQFKYVRDYANLSTKGAEVIGDIFEDLRSSAALKVACTVSPEGLMSARGCAAAFAETQVYAEAEVADKDQGGGRKRHINEMRRDKVLTAEIKVRTARVFAEILNDHVESIAFVERHKAGAEAVVRALAPHFQDETWAVLAEEGAVENVINCPPTVAKVLGRDSRYVDVRVSVFINQLQYPDIGRDIIKMLSKALEPDDFHKALQDDAAVKVWETVPGLFNNEFKYQHDAKGADKSIKNFKELLVEAAPVVKEIKTAIGVGEKTDNDRETDAKAESKADVD